jgi:hypothetical protein
MASYHITYREDDDEGETRNYFKSFAMYSAASARLTS